MEGLYREGTRYSGGSGFLLCCKESAAGRVDVLALHHDLHVPSVLWVRLTDKLDGVLVVNLIEIIG